MAKNYRNTSPLDLTDISASLHITREQARAFRLLIDLPIVTLAIMEEHAGKAPEAARVLIHRLRMNLADNPSRILALYNGGYYLKPDDRMRAIQIIREFRASVGANC